MLLTVCFTQLFERMTFFSLDLEMKLHLTVVLDQSEFCISQRKGKKGGCLVIYFGRDRVFRDLGQIG